MASGKAATMARLISATTWFGVAALAATACSAPPTRPAPNVPESIRAPASQVLFWEARATGVQIYECAARTDQPATFEWTFRAPEANLVDSVGKPIGRHYGGPTWEANDGSKVVAEVKGRAPAPDAAAIPWLLLGTKSVVGRGVLTQTASIQRVDTSGGLAPGLPCNAENATRMARVPYTATYYFFREAS
jgi:hypothetical protein